MEATSGVDNALKQMTTLKVDYRGKAFLDRNDDGVFTPGDIPFGETDTGDGIDSGEEHLVDVKA